MKLCKDCVHYREDTVPTGKVMAGCTREVVVHEPCLVSGVVRTTAATSCFDERYNEGPAFCGEAGKYWEKKTPVLDLSKPIKDGLKLKKCPMPSHHPTCDCNGEGGDR
jgi:hypothetical protein